MNLADSLMEEEPDTAYTLLKRDSVLVQKASKANRMRFALLKTQAEDKLFMHHKSDSLIREVVAYYEKHGNAKEQVQAYYLLGRVYHDLHLYGSALSAFEKVEEMKIKSDSVISCYKAQAATWSGAIYEEKSLDSIALRFRKQAYSEAKAAGNKELLVYTSRDIGRSLAILGDNQQAVTCYCEAIKYAKTPLNAYLYNMVSEELAYVYIRSGKLREARKALSTPIVDGERQDYVSRYSIWAFYYERLGMPDSSIMYYQKAIVHASGGEKRAIFSSLSDAYETVGAQEEAFRYARLALNLTDTLEDMQALETRDFVGKVMQNMEIQRYNTKLERERDQLNLLILTIALCVITACIVVAKYYKGRREKQRERERKLKKMMESKEQESLSVIEEGRILVQKLENELSSTSERLTKTQRELLEVKAEMLRSDNKRRLAKKKQAELLESEFIHSAIYCKFHDPKSAIDMMDFNSLEDSLNEVYDGFVIKLRELYPAIRSNEMQICCLLKIKVLSKVMCNIISCRPNTLSMAKSRLFKKITGKDGGANDLEALLDNL